MARTSISKRDAQAVNLSFTPEVPLLGEEQQVRDTDNQKDLDQKLVRGTFKFFERPNGTLRFSYRRYRGEKITTYILKDGSTYELPWGVVRAMEESSHYQTHNIEIANQNGAIPHGEREVMATQKGQARYAFWPDKFGSLA